MVIEEQNGNFLVIENSETVYTALSIDEAQGYIDWKLRPDAGNTAEDCACPD